MMDRIDQIRANARRLLDEMPPHVTLLAAAKTRTLEEVHAAYEAGLRYFGHNYVQEAEAMIPLAGIAARWHMIGHLQRNKAKQALDLFDLVETLDSIKLAQELEKRCAQRGEPIEVLIEVNSGLEEGKSGLPPQEVESLAGAVGELKWGRLVGLMALGPLTGDPQEARSYFVTTRTLFERLSSLNLPNTEMRVLSMGMSNSYRVAIQEGANLVRIGTLLFGPRA